MCIYKITNTINNDCYVGKTKGNFLRRFYIHKRNAKNGMNTHLYHAMRKYGEDNFIIEVLEETGDNINEREVYWISFIAPRYNMTSGGDGGDTSSSPNYIKGMKNRPTNDKFLNSSRMLGRNHSKETKIKQSAAKTKYWDNKTFSDRMKMFDSIRGENNPMFGKIPKNSCRIRFDGIEYNSIAEASRKTGSSGKFIKKHGERI